MTGIITKGEKRLVVVSGRAHPELAQDVASELGTEVLSSTAYVRTRSTWDASPSAPASWRTSTRPPAPTAS